MRGIVPVGYAVFALLLGTLVGLILRRSVPAMALTLAIYVARPDRRTAVGPPAPGPADHDHRWSSPDATLDGISTDGSGTFTITTHADSRATGS